MFETRGWPDRSLRKMTPTERTPTATTVGYISGLNLNVCSTGDVRGRRDSPKAWQGRRQLGKLIKGTANPAGRITAVTSK